MNKVRRVNRRSEAYLLIEVPTALPNQLNECTWLEQCKK